MIRPQVSSKIIYSFAFWKILFGLHTELVLPRDSNISKIFLICLTNNIKYNNQQVLIIITTIKVCTI